jgi:hypothetical protein
MSESFLTDDDIIRFTQKQRKALVDVIIEKGIPEIDSDRAMLLTALADMDRTALGNKRIGAAEKLAESDRLVADAIVKLNARFGSSNPFEGNESSILEGSLIRNPELDKLPEPKPVPGETDIGISDMKYDEFVDLMDNK